MARKLSIRVGELFAEVCDSSTSIARWFLPKKPLSDGLKEKVTLADYSELNFELLYRSDALPSDRFQSRKIAALVTSGFEGLFAQTLAQNHLPVSNDLIFGNSERVDSSGKISKQIDHVECELIAQKLKLMKIETVIVASINSDLNFENQNAIASFFRDQALKVFTSQSKESGELGRWGKLLEQVRVSQLTEDIEEQISEIIKTVPATFKTFDQIKFNGPTLYAGLDIFWLSGVQEGPIVLESQPSDLVETGFFDAPEFRRSLQRNGPLLLGKSMRPTALDLFMLDDPTLAIDGVVTAQLDRMRSRIEEALVTMSKAQQGTTRIDGAKVTNDTLNMFVTSLAWELKNLAPSLAFKIVGPLAKPIAKHLKQIGSNLNCELGSDV